MIALEPNRFAIDANVGGIAREHHRLESHDLAGMNRMIGSYDDF